MSAYVKKFEKNIHGRDFIVGDIHGSFSLLQIALMDAGFNPVKDRLFCCGDLIDRGPESEYVIEFLTLPFVHSVRGNHEQMLLDLYKDGTPSKETLTYACQFNGLNWWLNVNKAKAASILNALKKLPYAMEIETERGTVGVVHAEVPLGITWSEFVSSLETDENIREICLWDRTRIENNDMSGVEGIDRVFVGHTPQSNGLKKYGNVYAIDTGAVFGYAGGAEDCRLTLANIATSTRTMLSPRNPGLIDILNPDELPNNKFGVYGLNGL